MASKKITSKRAWEIIDELTNQFFLAIPSDFSNVYTKASDIPKDIKAVILYREWATVFMLEFGENGDAVLTKEESGSRNLTGPMKEVYDKKYSIVSGEYNSPNGELPSYQDHKYVDLGLPSGLRWATADVGRFAWAESAGKDSFSKSNARKRTKFSDVKGDAKMDAARVRWGGKWRTPTPEEFQELIDCCSWQWRGWGFLLTGPNGKQLYLSACGYNYSAWGPLKAKVEGYYWTTISKEGEDNASCLFFSKDEKKLDWKESYMGMCIRPVFSETEVEPVKEEVVMPNPEDYNKGIVKENGVLLEKFIFSGDKNWRTGNRATAQQKIKTGDIVELKFLGASEEEFSLREFNGAWDTYDSITVMGENFYFEVVVNDKQAYYGKYAGYRYTPKSVATGPTYLFDPKRDRTAIGEGQVMSAFSNFKDWLQKGAKDNDYWHGLYKKSEFKEKISYGMPGEENVKPVQEKTWEDGDIIDEGDGVFTIGGIRYELFDSYERIDGKDKKVSVLKVLPLNGDEKYSGAVTIPETVKYRHRNRAVTEVECEAFDNCPELTEINLPKTISDFPDIEGSHKLVRITVAEGNPDYCSIDGVLYGRRYNGREEEGVFSLLCCYPHAHGEQFVIPDFVNEIVAGAFKGCQLLKSVVISDNVTSIDTDAFEDCSNLESITWGAGIRFIRNGAFENCTALKSIVFPESVEYVNSSAFKGCSNIVSVTFAKGRYFDLDTLPKELFPWGKDPFVLNGIRYVPRSEWDRKSKALLEIVDFPKEEIEDHVNDDVQTLSIPATIEHDGFVYEVYKSRAAFSQFPSLRRLELPATAKDINIASIKTLRELVVDADNSEYTTENGLLFNKQKDVLLSVPRGLDNKTLIIPDGVEKIEQEACKGNSFIEEIIIPDSTVTIEKGAFAHCSSLHDARLGNGLQKIGTEAFAYTAIERIVLPPHARFTNHDTWDGRTAFYGSKLKAYELDGEHELYTVIDGVLYVNTNWGLRLRFLPAAFEGHLQIPEGVYEINKLACWGCNGLRSVFVPDGVKYIEDSAFSGCVNLESVEIDGHVDKIGSHSFCGCTSLKEIDCIGVKNIEDTAFRGIKGLKLNLPYALEKKRSGIELFFER